MQTLLTRSKLGWQFCFIDEHYRNSIANRIATLTFALAHQFLFCLIVRNLAFARRARQNLKQCLRESVRVF